MQRLLLDQFNVWWGFGFVSGNQTAIAARRTPVEAPEYAAPDALMRALLKAQSSVHPVPPQDCLRTGGPAKSSGVRRRMCLPATDVAIHPSKVLRHPETRLENWTALSTERCRSEAVILNRRRSDRTARASESGPETNVSHAQPAEGLQKSILTSQELRVEVAAHGNLT